MRRLLLAISLALPWLPITVVADSFVSLTEGTYKMGSAPPIGVRLPVTGPVFKVYSESPDRFDFVGKKNQNLTFVTTISGYCERPRTASSATVEIAGVSGKKTLVTKRGEFIKEQITVSVPHSKLGSFNAVKACNDELRTLAIETGLAKKELVKQGFTLRYEDAFQAKAWLFCNKGPVKGHIATDSEPVDVWVKCVGSKTGKPAPGQGKPDSKPEPPPRARPVSLVRRLEFKVDKPNYIGKCPVSIQFTGRIVANRKGIVKYRTVAHDGSRSPVFGIQFDGPGAKAISPWSQTFAKPDPSGQLSAGGSTQKGPTYKGWRRLEIVEPKGVRASEKAEYSIICMDEALQLEAQPVEPKRPPKRVPKRTAPAELTLPTRTPQ